MDRSRVIFGNKIDGKTVKKAEKKRLLAERALLEIGKIKENL